MTIEIILITTLFLGCLGGIFLYCLRKWSMWKAFVVLLIVVLGWTAYCAIWVIHSGVLEEKYWKLCVIFLWILFTPMILTYFGFVFRFGYRGSVAKKENRNN